MNPEDYDKVYHLWTSTAGMGMRSLDDSYEGIHKAALVVFRTNEIGNSF